MPEMRPFAELAAQPDPRLDLLAVALAAEFREVDRRAVVAKLDLLGAELQAAGAATAATPEEEARLCVALLGDRHGFTGEREHYDHPDNSMLDVVLTRRRGLPILLSVVYVEVARRAGIPLAGVGLRGHFVVGHFGAAQPLLLDPFAGGAPVQADAPPALVRPWGAAEIAMRMLNNLVAGFSRRGDLSAAIRAADLRLELPVDPSVREGLRAESRAMQARLN